MQSTRSHNTRSASASRETEEHNAEQRVDIEARENVLGISHKEVGQVAASNPVVRQSMMSVTRELLELGKEMGLEGKELQNFIKEEKDKESDRVERERERQFQLEQMRIQVETNQNANNNSSGRNRRDDDDNFHPKVPFLDDKDDIESWFQQFEHYAHDCQLTDEKKASRMIYFLKGKARVIYSKLSAEDAKDYEILKNSLYEGFQLNAEEYRKKFRSAKRGSSETYKELVTRLERYLDKWVELDRCDVSVEKLKDLILREQVLETLPSDLAVHVKDRNPESAKEIGKIAMQYELNRVDSRSTRFGSGAHGRRGGGDGKQGGDGRSKGSSADSAKPAGRALDDAEREKLRAAGLCFYCKKPGHTSRFCPVKKSKAERGLAVKDNTENMNVSEKLDKLCDTCKEKEFSEGVFVKLDGQVVKAFRDSGCTSVMVSSRLVPKESYISKVKETTLAEKGVRKSYKVAVMHVDSPYFKGRTEVTVLDDPVYPVLIGKWYGLGKKKRKTPLYPVRDPEWYESEVAAAVTTRKEAKEGRKENEIPLPSTSKGIGESSALYTPEDLRKAQKEDVTLAGVRRLAETGEMSHGAKFLYKKGILYRSTLDRAANGKRRVVVPKPFRTTVLSFGHDHPMAGHLGQKKTTDRIKTEFWWPGFAIDIKRHCLSCDICQRAAPKSCVKKVPLGHMATVGPVFKRVAVDIVGPILPMSESKKQYILVMVDYATRYPEATALKNIRAETVAEALWEMWTRLGIPDEIITDQGTQFTSNLMKEVNEFLVIKHKTTAPFHPQANGLVERFNGTLKNMLKKMAVEQPTRWDTFIPALLFAYREAPQESLGFSPFELLYGRTIKGPMQILRQTWTEEDLSEEVKTTAEYVVNLRNKIEATCNIARQNLGKASQKQAKYFNKKAVPRTIEVGKKVLLLCPLKLNKLELSWRGPFEVIERINRCDYRIQVGPKKKVYHINLMKEYIEREVEVEENVDREEGQDPETDDVEEDHVAVVIEEDNTVDDDIFQIDAQRSIPLLETVRTENATHVKFSDKLSEGQRKEAQDMCREFENNLTDVPLTTNLERCQIKVTEPKPVFVRPRPIPHAMVKTVEEEIDEMLKLGVIEPANSPYNSPIVLVKKKQGTYRFCCDLRGVNNVVVFDAEPITDVEHLFQSLGKAKYFTKLDLTKGYWAIPIDEEDRDKTAFTTSRGQFRWVNLPFGLKTATGVFNRMMRKLLGPIKRDDVHHFMDDILIATETWEEHMTALRAVLQRLQEANLAAKPSKCYVGFDQLPYLGHEIGDGKRWPESDKVDKINQAIPPITKKELRSFLGLTGFYREYIDSYSSIAIPLTDMTKKDHPEKLQWSEGGKASFATLKRKICETPILCMPDDTKEFVVRTDASDRGIGAVLMQDKGGQLRPISYQSRKLNGAESRYATVEKECLATVWGVNKFERYLYGKHFTLETDHQPLKFLQKQPTNPRLMRWVLQLQPYSFTVRVIPGRDNHGADYLSRATY